MRSKIEYIVNNRSKLVEKLIMLEDRNNSQFNKESYYTWKELAEECSNSGDITMFATGYKEDLDIKDPSNVIGTLNAGDKFRNRNNVIITIVEPQKDGTIQYKNSEDNEVRAGSERSIQNMLYANHYQRIDENLNEEIKKLNNREKKVYIDIIENCEDREDLEDIIHEIFFYDKGLFAQLRFFPKDASFEELKANKIAILKDSLLDEKLNEALWDNYLIEFKDLDDGKTYSEEYEGYDRKEAIELFRIDYPESDNYKLLHVYKLTGEGWEETYYNFNESLEEDYQNTDDTWGNPYSFDEVERELKKLTNNWTDKEGTIRCYYEQEKNYGLQILKDHYKYIDVSDGRTGPGQNMSWVLAYEKPREKLEESILNESISSNLQDKIIDCIDWFILMEMEFPKDKFLANSWEDLKEGIEMGIDPEFEVAEGIIEYFKPIVKFNKRYNKEVEEEGIFQDEIELYQDLVRAMNNFLAKNGFTDRIKE